MLQAAAARVALLPKLGALPAWSGLPIVVAAGRAASEGAPSSWAALPAARRWALGADVLLIDACLLTVAAAVYGVVVGLTLPRAPASGTPASWSRHASPLLVFLLLSGLLSFITMAAEPGGARRVVAAHAVLAAAAVAWCGLGACLARARWHALDAAAVSLLLASAALVGVLVAGPSVQTWSSRAVSVGLLASPLVSTAAAADIDLVRLDLFYRLSPLAHLGFEYPALPVAVASYLGCALLCWAPVLRGSRLPKGRT